MKICTRRLERKTGCYSSIWNICLQTLPVNMHRHRDSVAQFKTEVANASEVLLS